MMSRTGKYRIREARVEVTDRCRTWHERRFLAERRVTLFGLFSWWSPVLDGEWRESVDAARRDAARDAELREPPMPPLIIDPRKEQP
jgi:hypothetical protein